MLCRKKLSPRRRRLRRYCYIFLLILLILCVYIEFAVKIQLTDVIIAQLKILSERAVNTAVTEFLTDHPEIGESLTFPHYADSGAVTSITSDPAAINYLKATVSERAQDQMETIYRDEGFSVPLGSFSGLVLFTNLGPSVRLDIGSRRVVNCHLKSAFESAGINQTLHHVILTVDVDIVVYNPFKISRTIHTSVDFEIAQTVIVGSVPNYSPSILW